ncbi:MAG: TRADD-N-associated membrane domain-containing protein [Candidatus Electronema sp. V4]|uniref:TRADD-N-associated membrane domain-containing protein n=1 Tax=Candidatus Electronema sp. V4 TaxID=3454756 RepID=UPI0040555E20
MASEQKRKITVGQAVSGGINAAALIGSVINSHKKRRNKNENYLETISEILNESSISEDKAFERINVAVRMNLEQLEQNLAQARKESNQFFKLTLVFSSVGFLVVLAAVALLLGGQTVAGIVSAVASAIPEVIAALFFKKDRELRNSIERYHHHLIESQRILTMIDVAETVQSQEERDSIKREIICKALGVDASTVGSKIQLTPL